MVLLVAERVSVANVNIISTGVFSDFSPSLVGLSTDYYSSPKISTKRNVRSGTDRVRWSLCADFAVVSQEGGAEGSPSPPASDHLHLQRFIRKLAS